jgi:hypothetical protein
MSYTCSNGNLNGWFDDLLQAGERIVTDITRQSPSAGYGTYGGSTSTPPMFPPTYGLPTTRPATGLDLNSLLPYLLIGGVALYFFTRKGR